jgi:hypothetical protein
MQDYPELLRSSIDAAGSSRRALSFALAEETDNQQPSEYRALGRYLAGKETPTRERAAILAVLLKQPLLALVTDAKSRRQVRLQEVEAEVAQLRREFDLFVQAVTGRRADYESVQELATPGSVPASKERPGE